MKVWDGWELWGKMIGSRRVVLARQLNANPHPGENRAVPRLPVASAAACAVLIVAATWSCVGGVVVYFGPSTYALSAGGVTYWTTDLPIGRWRVEWLELGDAPFDAARVAADLHAPFRLRFAGFAFGRFDTTDPRDLWLRATAPEGRKPPRLTDTVLVVLLWPFVLLTAWPPVRAWRRRRVTSTRGFDVLTAQ
jgi:hypothetical protein